MTLIESSSEPIRTQEDLLLIFRDAQTAREQWRVGAEIEKFGVEEATGAPIPYDGRRSVLRILEELEKNHGWKPERERDGGPLIALLRDQASITLEPGGQLELSGAPARSIGEIEIELRKHVGELAPISRHLGVRWLALGFHPFARREDFSWVPKDRYGVMHRYLPTRGSHALDMMLRTCTVQANFDYESEADAMKKMRVALKLAPLTTAMFANSPWVEGKSNGATYRGRVWLDVDPDRSGLVEVLWRSGAGFADYVEWALDAPMFLFKRDGAVILNTGQTFRKFWKDGYQGHHATLSDWQMHLNTLFPEVRLKKTIEIRGADSQGFELACALPALWTAILYDEKALDEADAWTRDWSYAEVSALRPLICEHGWNVTFHGEPLRLAGEKLLSLADGGLKRRAAVGGVPDESRYLKPLRRLIEKGFTPSDALMDGLDKAADRRSEILARTDLLTPHAPLG